MSQNKPPLPSVPRRVLAAAAATAVVGAVGVTVVHDATDGAIAPTAATTNPVTPGNFGGWAFDQCQAPSQSAMDTWLSKSPFLGVGIYIAGSERGCRNQTYLNAAWVKNQLSRGWKLLPITLGPQASCNPRFPRYKGDVRINPTPGAAKNYAAAKNQGIGQAKSAVATAQALGIVKGSTMFYDLEAFDVSNTNCRESALQFLSGWTSAIHSLGYVSGVYSSAGSGLKELDKARTQRPKAFNLPDQVWIADWDGKANTSSSYISSSGWQPHARVKQYEGGHYETYGGVKIDIDRDYASLGQGIVAPQEASHCGGVSIDLASYPTLSPSKTPPAAAVEALKCLLNQHGYFSGHPIANGTYGTYIQASVRRWKQAHHWAVNNAWSRSDWISLLTAGAHSVVKFGSAKEDVRVLQRALNVAYPTLHLPITGAFATLTSQALKAYQKQQKQTVNGVAQSTLWSRMRAGYL